LTSPPAAARRRATNLVRLCRVISAAKVDAFLRNQGQLIPLALLTKGKAKWDAAISHLSPISGAESTDEGKRIHPPPAMPEGDAFHRCPHCNIAANCTKLGFQSKDLETKAKCPGCRKVSRINDWLCTCGSRWHLCPTHFHRHEQLQNGASPIGQPPPARMKCRTATKRKLLLTDNGTYESILAEDLETYDDRRKRIRLNQGPLLTLTCQNLKRSINPNFLSPNLRRRFNDIIRS
jgi:hypothetical protein